LDSGGGMGISVNGAGAVILVYGQGLFPGRSGMASGLTMGLGNTVGAFGAWVIGSFAQSHGMAPAVTVAAGCLWLGLMPIFLMKIVLPTVREIATAVDKIQSLRIHH